LPSSVLNGKSLFYKLYGREPSLSHIRSFGCLCFGKLLEESEKFSQRCKSSSPNDDGRDPSGSNIDSNSNSDDIAKKQSFDDDQGSVQIGEENFPEGNVPENNNVPTHFLDIGESSGLRRSSTLSKLPTKLNDYVLNSKAMYGLDKFVNHTWLSAENCGFIANINKSFEPKSYEEAAHDK
ncbi:hypothetical protein Tco_0074678, partial [Tanacetum coccineum]